MKEFPKSKNKLRTLPALMTRKNLRKDSPNLSEVSESSRLVEDLRLKLVKSRTESKMRFALQERLWKKVLSSVEVALSCTLPELSTT